MTSAIGKSPASLTNCFYRVRIETKSPPALDDVFVMKLVEGDKVSADIPIPLQAIRARISTSGLRLYEFDCEALALNNLSELLIWKENSDSFPSILASITVARNSANAAAGSRARKWKFDASTVVPKAKKDKVARLVPVVGKVGTIRL